MQRIHIKDDSEWNDKQFKDVLYAYESLKYD